MKNIFYTSFPAVAPFAFLIMLSISQMSLSEKNILGHWSYDGVDKNEIIQYKSKTSFTKSKRGIAFLNDGKLIVRQNAGWCGTPPVSYRNFDGEWKWIDENHVALKYAFWGGTILEEWEIVSVDNGNLSIKRNKHETLKEPFKSVKE